MRDRQALARQRLLTLAFGDMETIRMVSSFFFSLSRFLPIHTSHSSLTLLPYVTAFVYSCPFAHLHPRNWKLSQGSGQNLPQMLRSFFAYQSSLLLSMLL